MIRVVADTTIFISALMFGGIPGTFLDLAFVKSFQLATSPVLLDELDEKLRGKFEGIPEGCRPDTATPEKDRFYRGAGFRPAVIKDDPDDNRVLECAVAAKADYIVSGDRHLLKLGSYRDIPIMTVRQFMDAIGADA